MNVDDGLYNFCRAILYCLDKIAKEETEQLLDPKLTICPQTVRTMLNLHWSRGAHGGEAFEAVLKQRFSSEMSEDETMVSEGPKVTQIRPVFKLHSSKSILSRTDQKSTPERKPVRLSMSRHVTTTRCENYCATKDKNDVEDAKALSKKLLHLCSPPRRRSSVPITDVTVSSSSDFLSSSSSARRHSSHLEQVQGNLPPRSKDICDNIEEGMIINANRLGELVDSMTNVEPCIVRNALEYQLPLLFGRNDIANHSQMHHCRSFLMTVLTHQAGWETVEKCIILFLKEFNSS